VGIGAGSPQLQIDVGIVGLIIGVSAGSHFQHHFSLEDEHELIFMCVPMSLARPSTGGQPQQIYAEIRQIRGVAESVTLALRAGCVERRGVLDAAGEARTQKSPPEREGLFKLKSDS
jgi:hypothetical protein